MSNIAIHTENLGKRYRLGATVDFSRTFREALLGLPKYFYQLSKSKAQRLLDKNEYPKDTPKGTFWALRDINLDIRHGDVVGIIGRNGAGKSTLLKILSKITSPTTGIARINGRVGSLLEVGTGFHPELSGRENIYLNGSILGMRKAEIQKKFDEIVAFAEVEQFLDTPIKRYSSGMQVRLAFAVAAHLEPEILIVDEVLAVGDAAFQKKCLGKMEDVSKEGRTVLFVSHNMVAVRALCKNGVLLENGKVKYLGPVNTTIQLYQYNIINGDNSALTKFDKRTGTGQCRLISMQILTNDIPKEIFNLGDKIVIKLTLKKLTFDELKSLRIIIGIYNTSNEGLLRFDTESTNYDFKLTEEVTNLYCSIDDQVNIKPDDYYANVAILNGGVMLDYIVSACHFSIYNNDYFKSGKGIESSELYKVLYRHKWKKEI